MTRIEEIEAREKAATLGKWTVKEFVNLFEIYDSHWSRISNGKTNRDFIAHAREDIPYLLAQLGEARAENRALKRRMGKAGWETALLLRRAERKLEAVEEMGRRLKGMGGRYGWLHPYSLRLIVDALDRILHPQEAE